MNRHWTYQIFEITPSMLGPPVSERLQDELDRRGADGWELVGVMPVTPFDQVRVVMKKEA
ncbi:DUF4177 domain-containing protein [Lysobacter cavernae]|uniref:DUF4177 domain-containing protein n=1 Tax=Lysobacter cavernae TaxID=1685901 RepID=A0ABV7RQY5_9GAMM